MVFAEKASAAGVEAEWLGNDVLRCAEGGLAEKAAVHRP